MRSRLISLTWWIEQQACRFREWLDPEPECTLPTITISKAEWEAALRRALDDLAKYKEPKV